MVATRKNGLKKANSSSFRVGLSIGLPLVLRGIQQKDWNDVTQGIVLSLEQTENYERSLGPEGTRDKWHDRSKGVEEATAKGVGKWMPEELMKLAERNVQERER